MDGRVVRDRDAHSVSQASVQPLTILHGTRLPIPKPEIPTGGRLRFFSKAWEKITSDAWTRSVIRSGYRIQFRVRPRLRRLPLSHMLTIPSDQEKLRVLQNEIKAMLQKQAIERVTDRHNPSGFFSRLFLVRKKKGGWRPIIDLSHLNRSIVSPHFKMETLDKVRLSLNQGDWVTSLDLKDAYFHIAIHPRSRRYLRFAFQGVVYQFRALPFGLCTAPYVFTRVVKAMLRFIHQRGIRLHAYLDDWLQPANSKELATTHMRIVMSHTLRMGFIPNWEKSELEPTQVFVFLGARCNLSQGLIGPSPDRIARIRGSIMSLQQAHVASARTLHGLLGQMESMARLLPQGRARKRLLQWETKSRWSQESDSWDQTIVLGQWFRDAVSQWLDQEFLYSMVPLHPPVPDIHLFTDASLIGWGAHLEDQVASGKWSMYWRHCHINTLELRAVFLALKQFVSVVEGRCVLVATDNTTVASYVNKEGGSRSRKLCLLSMKILTWCANHSVTLRARFLPGKLNILADSLSREGGIVHTEWTLHAGVLKHVFSCLGTPHVDLFATRLNHQLPTYVSPVPDSLALGVDSLSMTWEGMHAYAFPPFPLLSRVMLKIRKELCLVLLIAPLWPGQPWFSLLLSLLVDIPICLPHRSDLLCQPRSRLYHANPAMLHLHAFVLCNDACKRRAFLNRLPSESVHLNAPPPTQFMGIGGKCGWIGVSEGKWIPSVLQ